MTAPDDPGLVSTTYTVTVSGKAERFVRTLAEAWQVVRPSALGTLGQLPDLASEAFARGLVEIAREYGLDVDPGQIVGAHDDDTRRAAESAALAREARFLRAKDGRAAMSRLAEAFPTLRDDVPGVRPWDPEALDGWLGSPAVTSGSRDAAAFVLGVWNGNVEWSVAFDAHRALGCWDRAHRAAFLAWASAPWWP